MSQDVKQTSQSASATCATAPEGDKSFPDGFKLAREGVNRLGNEYSVYAGSKGQEGYTYHNQSQRNGSYYYKSPSGTGYFLAADGYQQYTTADGTRYVM